MKPAPATAVLAALGWALAQVLVHRPRGFPMEATGEWDILLPASALAAGERLPALIGMNHGQELGGYVVALLAAPGIALGLDPTLVGKLVAIGFGAGAAAVCAAAAASLASARSERGSWAAGLFVAAVFAAGWPGMHFEFAGITGRTPEAVLPQLLAALATVGALEGRRLGAAVAGLAAGVALLLSPVAAWTALSCGLLLLVGSGVSSARERLRRLVAFAAGLLAPAAAVGLLLPGGGEGLLLHFGDLAARGLRTIGLEPGFLRDLPFVAPPGGAPGPGLSGLLARAAPALEGGAHNPALVLRPALLAALLLGAGAAVVAAGASALRAPRVDAPAWIALLAASWAVPLSGLELDRFAYPLSYRYWTVPLALAFVLFGAGIGRLAEGRLGGRLALLAPLLVLLIGGSTLPRSMVAPAPTRAEALLSTGAHAMDPRRGMERHAAFRALFPHAPRDGREALAEGYGLALGADAAVTAGDGEVPTAAWQPLRGELSADEYRALLRGVGCGATAVRRPAGALRSAFAGPDEDLLLHAFAWCGRAPGRDPRPDLSDFADLPERASPPDRPAAPRPWEWMPLRW